MSLFFDEHAGGSVPAGAWRGAGGGAAARAHARHGTARGTGGWGPPVAFQGPFGNPCCISKFPVEIPRPGGSLPLVALLVAFGGDVNAVQPARKTTALHALAALGAQVRIVV
jgi:hypothetical protein